MPEHFTVFVAFLRMNDAMDDFDWFYDRYHRLVYAAALSQTGEVCAAEDLTQETLLRAWRHRDEVFGLAVPAQRAWLLTTVRRASVDRARKEKPDRWQAWESVPEAFVDADDDRAALRLDVARALGTLDATDREIVLLRHFEELDSVEIGATLGLPEGTVRRRLTECRKRLGRLLTAWQGKGNGER